MTYISRNPFTGETNGEFSNTTEKELQDVLKKSELAFDFWRKSDLNLRSSLLNNFASLLIEERREHAELMTSEMGKPVSQAIAEVEKSALACRYYADNLKEMLKPKKIVGTISRSKILYEPQGTVFAIMPWNFPYWQLMRCLAPTIASGNTLILKHASNVPRCSARLEETFLKAGAHIGLFQNLYLDHNQTASVVESRTVRTVSLTGSNVAGEIIAAKAGSAIKKCVLELGGSDPFIVFKDADLEKAAEAAVTGRFQNNGQSCIASKRLFVENSIYEPFMELFVNKVKSLKLGNPMENDTDIGPLVNVQAVEELRDQVDRSIRAGAKIVCGNIISEHGPEFFEPMVLTNVPLDSAVSTEETFGPVIPVFSFSDYNDLIMNVNASIFGLGSSVWTNNQELISKIEKDIDAGTVSFNGFTRSDPMLPFGGVKASGYGRELSEMGMMEFLNIKTVSHFT